MTLASGMISHRFSCSICLFSSATEVRVVAYLSRSEERDIVGVDARAPGPVARAGPSERSFGGLERRGEAGSTTKTMLVRREIRSNEQWRWRRRDGRANDMGQRPKRKQPGHHLLRACAPIATGAVRHPHHVMGLIRLARASDVSATPSTDHVFGDRPRTTIAVVASTAQLNKPQPASALKPRASTDYQRQQCPSGE